MSLGNGNPKEGDKGSNFNYEVKVLQGLEAIAVALENQVPDSEKNVYEAIYTCSGTTDPVTVNAEIQNTTGYKVQISQPTAGSIDVTFWNGATQVEFTAASVCVIYNNNFEIQAGQKMATAAVGLNKIQLRSYYLGGPVPNPPDNYFDGFYFKVKFV